jgi:hypothetical protein
MESVMSDLLIDIQDDVERGELTYQQIAEKYNIPLDWVKDAVASLECE